MRAPLIWHSLPLLSLTALGCAGLKPAPDASGLSPLAVSCAQPSGQDAQDPVRRQQLCLRAFEQASAARDARSAGQALLVWARAEDAREREAWVRLALWLNPQPWLPAQVGFRADELTAYTQPSPQVKPAPLATRDPTPGLVLRFAGTPSLEGVSSQQVALALPPSANAARAMQLATAAGAVGLLLPAQEQPQGPPQLYALIGQLTALTRGDARLEPSDRQRLEALAQADASLAREDLIGASSALHRALKDSQGSASSCHALGTARAASLILSDAIFGATSQDTLDALTQGCVAQPAASASSPKHGAVDPAWAAYWSLFVELEADLKFERSAALARPSGLRDFEASRQASLSALTPSHRAWVDTLLARARQRGLLAAQAAQPMCRAPQPDLEQLTGLKDALITAGRADLALGLDPPSSAPLLQLIAQLRPTIRQAPRWHHRAYYRHLFEVAALSRAPLDRVAIYSVCQDYARLMLGQAQEDRAPGAPSRGVERMMELVRLQSTCPDQAQLVPLADATLTSIMAMDQGPARLMDLMGHVTLHGLARLFQGKLDEVFPVVQAMSGGLDALAKQLPPTREGRATTALLAIAQGLIAQSPVPELVERVEQALSVYDELLQTPVSPAEPELMQRAPAIRLALAHAVLAARALSAPGALPAQIQRIEATLEEDLGGLLRLLDVPQAQAPPLAAHLRVIYSGALALLSQDPATLKAQLARVEALPAASGQGLWPMVLRGLRVSAALGVFIQAHQLQDQATRAKAQALARAGLEQLIEAGLKDFEVQGTHWELTRVLVPGLDLAVMALLDEGGAATRAVLLTQVLPDLERQAKLVLQSIEEDAQRSQRYNFVDLFVAILRASLDVGLIGLYDVQREQLSTAALLKIAQALEDQSSRYSASLQVYIHTIIGALRAAPLAQQDAEASSTPKTSTPKTSAATADAATADALAAFERATALAQGTTDAFLPLLFALRMQRLGWTQPAQTLALVQRVIDMARPQDDCADREGLAALYPQHARLLELTQQPEAARQARLAYLASLDAGYSGDSTLSCQVQSAKGYLQANLNLVFPMSALAFKSPSTPVKDDAAAAQTDDSADQEDDGDSTFQLGLGFSSIPGDSESMGCTVQTSPQRQLARQHQVLMDEALASLWRDEPAHANVALGQLLALHKLLLEPQHIAQEARYQGVSQELQRLDLGSLLWVVNLAALRGYTRTALQLYNDHHELAKRSTLPLAQRQQTPIWIERHPSLKAMEPIIRLIHPDDEGGAKRAQLPAALNAWMKLASASVKPHHLDLLMVSVHSREGDLQAARRSFAQLRQRQGSAPAVLLQGLAQTLEPGQTPEQRLSALSALTQSEYALEATTLIEFGAQELTSPQAHALLLSVMSDAAPWRLPLRMAAAQALIAQPVQPELMIQALQRLHQDRLTVQGLSEWFNESYLLARYLARQRRWPQAEQVLSQLIEVLARSFPLHEPTITGLMVTQLALRALHEPNIAPWHEALSAFVLASKSAPAELKAAIESWTPHLADPEALKLKALERVQIGLDLAEP